jgi:octaprenyl-diphosphate synthase
MLSFHQVVSDDFKAVNKLILDQIHSDVTLVEDIGNYLVEAGGKRLRPLLVLLMARALNYEGKQQHTLAAIIEFIHTATLLHDDVVDTSDLRRGRATANAKWGNAPSVLVGDFLYSRSFQLMVSIGDIDVMRILADTTNIISEGEVQQLINAGNPNLSEANYNEVIHKKTAVLFEAACETAATLCKVSEEQQLSLKSYGYHLGMAFQLIDDALDYMGSSEDMGKNIGDDLAEGKPTLPLIFAMEHGKKSESDLIANTIKEGSGEVDPSKLKQIVTIVQQTGAIDYTQEQAKVHAEKAKASLSSLADTQYKQALFDLADFSISRNH